MQTMNPKKKKKLFSKEALSSAFDTSSNDYYAPPKDPQIAPAAATALQAGGDPGILSKAQGMLGSKEFTNLCERFAEVATKGKSGLFASAIDAFNKQKDQVRNDFQNMPPGSQICFPVTIPAVRLICSIDQWADPSLHYW